MTPAILGGLLIILGSFFVSRGEIFKSVFAFAIADICWIFLALASGDIYGAVTVTIGMIFGIVAFYRMHKGQIRKDLKW